MKTSTAGTATALAPAVAATEHARLLVVDDDRIILESLGEFLRLEGYEVETAPSFNSAVAATEKHQADLVLCDINMPGGNGFELLHTLRRRSPDTAVIMMTGYGTIESAVEAIKLGAYDYLTKPIVDDELKLCVQRALAQQAILRENRALKLQLEERFGLGNLIGQDYRIRKIVETVETVAPSPVTVLIQGPSGTGKSLVALALHQQSDRATKPFVEVSCGAIPESLLESELFGHVRGAFTGAVSRKEGKFAAADGGTIFLDEIATASVGLQIKLLRVLQDRQFEPVGSNKTRTVDVRVVLATNVNLEQAVREGRFREDLFYRVNVVTVDMPPLAERIGDVPLLAQHFLDKYAAENKRTMDGFSDDAIRTLMRYDWPGNVRELENAVERAVVLCRGQRIETDDLPPRVVQAAVQGATAATWTPVALRTALEEPEKRIIEAALRANSWNRQVTADQLEINRTTLYKKMKRYGLEEPQ